MDIRNPVSTHYGDWLTQFGESWKSQIAQLQQVFGSKIEEVRMPQEFPTDVPILYVAKDSIPEVLLYLRDEPGLEYGFLSDLTATDEEQDPRFEVVYILQSVTRQWRIRVKARVREGEEMPTAVGVWAGANWAEREVWDMFGIRFRGHPDLRRILMDERWVGHPLRKDYPLRGYQIFTTPQAVDPRLLEE